MSSSPATVEDGQFSGAVLNLFNDPKSALDRENYQLDSFVGFDSAEQYYIPPIPFDRLSKLLRVNPHHGALASLKARKAASFMLPNPMISRQTVVRALTDFEATGNGFFRATFNQAQKADQIHYLPTINTRRLKAEKRTFGWIKSGVAHDPDKLIKFKAHEVQQLMQHDPFQQIYGVPYWIGGLQSILLGEDVRVYMRMFFKNGGSTGDIVATAGLSGPAQDVMEELLDSPTGDGRFKRILAQFPRGEIDKMLKVLPYSTGSEKIDYSKLAAMTATDILEAWRMPPELAGMRPEVVGGSGDLDKIKAMYHENEIVPIQQQLADELEVFTGSANRLQFKDCEPISKSD